MERKLLVVFALTFLVIMLFRPLLKKYGPQAPASAPLQAASESETVIENDVYRIAFTNRGGRVKSWVLKKYTDDKGGALELVNTAAAEKYGYPLTLWSYDETLRSKLNSALYVATSTGATPPAEIKFVYDDGDVSVQKSFKFDRSSYVVGVQTAVEVKGAQVRSEGGRVREEW